MWVRSQNKEALVDVKAFDIVKRKTNFHIVGYLKSVNDNGFYLGIFKTKEKTMSVLDELQCRIARTESGVFPMPKDDDEG